jgi:hypothetical protein
MPSLEEQYAMSSEFAGAPLVATAGTYYPDLEDVRFELSLTTAEAYRDSGVPYVIVDASPAQNKIDAFVNKAYTNRGAMVVRADTAGIATQRQQGVRVALANGAEKILGSEPEKTGMANFAPQVSKALDAYDVLVVGRTENGENSLPPVQQRTERLAGWILQRTLDLPFDSLAGPRGFTVAGAEQLAKYPAHEAGMNNWIYLYKTPLDAREAGLAIGGLVVDLTYPEKMVAQETGNDFFDAKRYMQFGLQLDHLLRRPDVNPQSLDIARTVLDGLVGLGNKPTNDAYDLYISGLERDFAPKGYKPAKR